MLKKICSVQLFTPSPKQFDPEVVKTSPKPDRFLDSEYDDACVNASLNTNSTEDHKNTSPAALLLKDQAMNNLIKKSQSSHCKVNPNRIKSGHGVFQSIKLKISSTFESISHSPQQPVKKGAKEIKILNDSKSSDCPGRNSKNLLNIRAKCGGKDPLYHLPSKGTSEWLETAAGAATSSDACTFDPPASLYALPEVVLSSNQSLDKASNKLKTANWLLGSSAYSKCDSLDVHGDGHLHYGSNTQLVINSDNDMMNQSCLSQKSNLSYLIHRPEKKSIKFDNKENQIEYEQFDGRTRTNRTNGRTSSLVNHASKIVTANSVHSILSPEPESSKHDNNNHDFFENYKVPPSFHVNKKKSKKSQVCDDKNNFAPCGSGSKNAVLHLTTISKLGGIESFRSGLKLVDGGRIIASTPTNASDSSLPISIAPAAFDPSLCVDETNSTPRAQTYASCGDRLVSGRRPPKPLGFGGLPPIREDPIGGPAPPSPSHEVPLNWSQEFRDISRHSWYWGPISSGEAEKKLSDQPDGKFLVRDSSHNTYLLSLSFRSNGKTYHTRIEHRNGLFSLCPMSEHGGYRSLVKLIETVIAHSTGGVFCYTKPRNGGILPAFPVRLCSPLSRVSQVWPLQHLCYFVIHQHTRLDLIEQLPLPRTIKGYLAQKP